MRTATVGNSSVETVRAYVDRTYCAPFARKGWVYSDGALSIQAQHWLDRGGRESCVKATPGGSSRRVPCSSLASSGPKEIDCALVRHVRRREVKVYLRKLGPVVCDDGTRLSGLGVP
jgi:hypothetical protein